MSRVGVASTETKLSVLALVVVLVISATGGFVGGVAAASGNTQSVTLSMADSGITTTAATYTNHNWTVTVDSTVSAQLTHLKLDYSGTGTTFNSPSASDVTILVNGSAAGTISGVSTENTNQRLNVSFSSGPSLTGNERITVNTTGQTVANPATAGSYSASISLYDGTSVASASSNFQVTSGTYSGTVTNATSNSGLNGASVSVLEGGQVVGSTSSSSDGTYSLTLGPGTYNISVSRTHFENAFIQTVGLNASESKTQNAALSPTGVLDGTVTNKSSGSAISGASVSLVDSGTNTFYSATTGGSGGYSKTVAAGTYDVKVSASGYVTTTKQASVGPNGTVTTDFALVEAGTISGTVTAEDGTQLSSISVIAFDPDTGKTAASTQTGGSGGYSLSVGAGTYDVIAFDSSGTYKDAFELGVSVSTGGTTTQDVTMAEAPPKGTVTGTITDPNGNAVSGVTVEAIDDSYRNYNSTTTDGSGQYTLAVPEGTYEVSTASNSYADDSRQGVSVSGNSQTSVNLQLSQAAYISGSVTNSSGDVPGTFVVADSGNDTVFGTTDMSGDYTLTVRPDESYRVSVFAQNQTAASQTASPAAGNTATVDFSLQETKITHRSIEVLDPSGVDTGNVGLFAQVSQGMLMVQVENESGNAMPGMPNELEGLGVGPDTEFRINVTVTNYDPNTLLWGAKNVTWSTETNDSNSDATDISIRTKSVDLQGINGHGTTIGPLMTKKPSDVQWPSGRNDRADLGWNRTVYFGVFDMSTAPAAARQNFGGMTVTTNAQTFAPPRVVNDTLKVWVAGPHRSVDGATHSGFYEATIPDAQLSDWGVDPANAASELEVLYQGADHTFQVTDLDDGVRIHLDIHYSAGSVEVAPSPNAGSSSSVSVASSPSTTVRTVSDGDVVAVIETVLPGEPVVVPLADVAAGGVTVTETTLTFDMGTTASSDLLVTAAAAPPAGLPVAPASDTLHYLTIDVDGPLDGRATAGSFTFTVDGATLDDLGAEPSAVQAYHYDEAAAAWEPIPTTRLEGSTYEATTDSFSTFAVGVTSLSDAEEPSATATPDPTPAPTASHEPSSTPPGTVAVSTESASDSTPAPTPGADGPGFGVVTALVAVLAALAIRRRRGP